MTVRAVIVCDRCPTEAGYDDEHALGAWLRVSMQSVGGAGAQDVEVTDLCPGCRAQLGAFLQRRRQRSGVSS